MPIGIQFEIKPPTFIVIATHLTDEILISDTKYWDRQGRDEHVAW